MNGVILAVVVLSVVLVLVVHPEGREYRVKSIPGKVGEWLAYILVDVLVALVLVVLTIGIWVALLWLLERV